MHATQPAAFRFRPRLPRYWLGWWGLVVFLGGWTGSDANGADRPNIVLILVDDLGWSDAGCYGHRWHQTPGIDRLADEGMRFTNGYSPAPICSAARASLLTGKTTARLGFEFVTKGESGRQQRDSGQPLITPPFTLNLPLEESTIAEELSRLGYETAFFGKWHVNQHYEQYLGWHPDFGPRQQGFSLAIEDFGDHPYAWKRAPGGTNDKPADTAAGEFAADSMVRRVTDFIRGRHERSYFLMVATFYVHTPVKNRCRWLVEQYESRIPAGLPRRDARLEYAAFVETLDHHVGAVLAAIDECGQRDNTLVVLLSDNGGHPEYTGNAPLRGSKWNLYEGGIRVPLIARWPGRIAPGSTNDLPVIGYDLLPTFVQLAGGESTGVDGVSLVPSFSDPAWRPRRSLVWHFPYYHPEQTFSQAGVRIGVDDFQISQTRPQSALRRQDYKLIKFAEDERVELYDLATDLSEQHDLSGELPELAAEMEELLEQQLTEMGARRAVRAVK